MSPYPPKHKLSESISTNSRAHVDCISTQKLRLGIKICREGPQWANTQPNIKFYKFLL